MRLRPSSPRDDLISVGIKGKERLSAWVERRSSTTARGSVETGPTLIKVLNLRETRRVWVDFGGPGLGAGDWADLAIDHLVTAAMATVFATGIWSSIK
jgi:hypothetical protein